MDTISLLKELTETNGIPGREEDVARLMMHYMDGLAHIERDRLGSVIGIKRGFAKGVRVSLSAHLDEVGFMVKSITERGFLLFQPLGGWIPQVMPAHRVVVYTEQGTVEGIIGSKSKHLLSVENRKEGFTKEQLFIDIGTSSREETLELGVRIGDSIAPASTLSVLNQGQYIAGKALDNRLGCAALIQVLEALAEGDHPNIIYAIATAQEEIGRRGALTAAHLVQPELAIVLDTGTARDIPGAENIDGPVCGKGPLLFMYDASMLPNQRFVRYVEHVAEKMGIPLQYEFLSFGKTDAGQIHTYGAGVPTIVIGFPTRYMHTHNCVTHLQDYERVVRLVTALLRGLDQAVVDHIMFR
ncbi:M42 family metallopeptidase [Paenibacillus tyrfis]|uniref:M42 family metallopeptidase n=1 Tax=Paenibacillus tyrfis TaxID=1501230 RepID=UPI00209F4282|nr:M42 family metallopeptidase [Paenibacillus tyrfis]MCP1311566.1 M42 family metallopeptidase [Paenibacillus tyrfis]